MNGAAARYCFKLQFADGQWDVAEQRLASAPQVGDLLSFGRTPWRIVGTQRVPRPSRKPPRDLFLCAPAL